MAARAANIQGIKFDDGPAGSNWGGKATVTFDLIGTAYTGGTDTVTLGGGGYDERVATTLSLAAIMQARRRDGKTIVLTGVGGCQEPGYQGAVVLAPQAAALSGTTNVVSITLNTLPSGGASSTSTSANWDRCAAIEVTYYTSNG